MNSAAQALPVRSSADLMVKLRDDIARGAFREDGYIGTEVDMARETGLSRMTVRKAIDRLDFEGLVERRVAKGVFVKHDALLRGIVQVVVPSLEQHMPRQIVRGARLRARITETYLLVFDADFAVDYEIERLRQLPRSGARGAIVVSPHEMRFNALLRDFDAMDFPYVLVDDAPGDHAAAVASDNRQGGRLLADALARRDYRRPALLMDETVHTARQRRDGFLTAWADAGGAFTPAFYESLHRPADWTPQGLGHEHWMNRAVPARIDALLAAPAPPDVFVCENDFVAWDAWRALAARGVRVPDDAGLTGFDHAPELNGVMPRLFTVAQDMAALGDAAMSMLVERVHTNRRPADRLISVNLVEGDTIRPSP